MPKPITNLKYSTYKKKFRHLITLLNSTEPTIINRLNIFNKKSIISNPIFKDNSLKNLPSLTKNTKNYLKKFNSSKSNANITSKSIGNN